MTEQNHTKKQVTQRVTLIGAVVNVMLAVAQLVGGFFTASQALIADGVHTLSDLASDFVVLFAAQHAHKEADDDHPYGHGRIETVATVILGLMLAGVAVGIFLNAWERLLGDEPVAAPSPIAMLFAALAILSKEALFHYTRRAAREIKSKLLEANAWHHRSDVISSVIVLLGILGSQFGLPWLDGIAAVVVAAMILYMAGQMILDSTRELVDTGIEADETEAMRQFMQALPGVESVHMLRTRLMGGRILIDTHIQVNSFISVSEGHHIAEYVMHKLRHQYPDISDVTVHIDPENDELAKPSAGLPIREEVLAALQTNPQHQHILEQATQVVLHYHDGSIQLQIQLPAPVAADQLSALEQDALALGYIDSIKVYYAASH